MEEYLGNVTIGKVYKGKSGDGKHGPWQAWNFHIDGDDRKFSYFSGGKKPEPYEGAFIKMAKFETETKGQYRNHNIKELALDGQNSEPSQEPQGGPPGDYQPPGETPEVPPKSPPQAAKVTKSVTLPKQKKDISYSFFPKQAVDANTAWLTTGNFPTDMTYDNFIDSIINTTNKMYDAAVKKINEVPF